MPEVRQYCLCGGAATATSSDAEAVQFVSDAFDRIHTGEGHSPATARQASAARRREEARA